MKTSEQLASGEVAYSLQGDQKDLVWGQTIGTDKYPVIGGKTVYLTIDDNNNRVYSNTNI